MEQVHINELYVKAGEDVYVRGKNNNSLCIVMSCCGHELVCLIDTGSQLNIIDPRTIEKLRLENCIDIEKTCTITGVSTTNMSGGYIPFLELKNEHQICSTWFFVKSHFKNYDCILGSPFLEKYNANIHYSNKKAHIELDGIECTSSYGAQFIIN